MIYDRSRCSRWSNKLNHGAITSSIQAGRSLSQLAPQVAKLGALDSQIQAAEAGKHKGILSVTSTEAEAFAITQAKMAHKEAMEKMRETMLLFGSAGCGKF